MEFSSLDGYICVLVTLEPSQKMEVSTFRLRGLVWEGEVDGP